MSAASDLRLLTELAAYAGATGPGQALAIASVLLPSLASATSDKDMDSIVDGIRDAGHWSMLERLTPEGRDVLEAEEAPRFPFPSDWDETEGTPCPPRWLP